jgi:group I intron endonuclease
MYIYKFTHINTGRSYVGQTIQNPNQRRLEHIADSRHTPREYHFHNALRKYGIDSFIFEVIDQASSIEELNSLEEKYVEQFDSINNGFNIRQAGGNKLHSEESKQRMREAQKAAHARRRAEGREGGWTRKDGGPMKGKQCSKKHKEKVGMANKGKKRTDEQIERQRQILKNKTWKVIDGKRVWMNKEATDIVSVD